MNKPKKKVLHKHRKKSEKTKLKFKALRENKKSPKAVQNPE